VPAWFTIDGAFSSVPPLFQYAVAPPPEAVIASLVAMPAAAFA
jgi:hypothetical protein